MKRLLLLSIVLLPIAAAPQAPAPLIQNALNRRSILLDGDWQYIVDSRDIGNNRRYYQNLKPSVGSERVVEYNFETSPTLHVPGDWNSQRPELLLYEGTVWYEKSFHYHPQANTRAFLYLGAANYRSHLWLNGQSLCEHEGGFTPFNCDATALLKDGENFVVISVNDTRHGDDIPALTPDWWTYGGLTRSVSIVEVPQPYIEDYSLQLGRGSTRRIVGWVRLAGASAAQKVAIKIRELNLSQEATTDASRVARFAVDAAKLQLWSPENPKLYRIEIASGADHISDDIGFRSVEVRGTEILLNGRSLFLRGIDLHEEAPYRSGRAHGDDDARILLGWAKELGCNFVRLAHYPHDEHTTRMADRIGLLVWSEIPVYQAIDWNNHSVLGKAKQQLTEMVGRDKNRAAVILWSVTNESRVTEERNAFIRELIATARALDPTRLITAATNQFGKGEGHQVLLNDPIIADLDVFGINEYIGWYQGVPSDLDITTWSTPYNKPMIVSEVGGDAKYGLHGTAAQRWTEEYQEDIYKRQIAALRKIPFLRGISPWILKDFRSPHRLLPGIQDGYNRKGLISDTGERKKAFYVLQQFYREIARQK